MSRTGAACLAIAVLACLVAPVPAGAQDEPKVSVELGYTCGFPSGERDVRLGVTAVFPPEGTVGEPVRPAEPALRLSVPPAALADLTAVETASVTAVVRLTMTVGLGDAAAEGSWSGARVSPVPVPAAGDLVLDAPPEVHPVTVDSAGEVSFTAGELSVALTGYRADGTATEPPTIALTCAPAPDQDLLLATVSVSDGGPPPSDGAEEPGATEGIAVGESPARARVAPDDDVIPPECQRIPDQPPEFATPFCAMLLGFTNIAKLHAAAYQPAGIQNIMTTQLRTVGCAEGEHTVCQDARVLPNHEFQPQFPPAPNDFLPFGFVPSEATMRLTQAAPAEVYLWSTKVRPYVGLTTAKVKLSAGVSDVTVNGMPLDVGPNCRTEVPIDAVLTATYDSYSITVGGLLQGTVTIPPFSGCGVTEDLDPLLTGMISGPGNYVRMTQGRVCAFEGNQVLCPPVEPKPS